MQVLNHLLLNDYKKSINKNIGIIDSQNNTIENITIPNCCPAYFSPSFTAMKKREFEGTDKLVVEKFKAPIQLFKTKDDFNDWANKRTDEIFEKDYTGRTTESTIQRKAMLGEWRKYIFEENKEYTPAQRLLIADGITKELSDKNDSIPPTLNKGVLADTIYNLKETLKNEPNKKEYNFYDIYQNNLRSFYITDIESSTGTDMTGWVVIPSKKHDPEHFEENVEKLKAFSHENWCTKSNNAEPYLNEGDFHVYLENGNPTIGVRFVGDNIQEIQGPKNNNKIPFKHYDICKKYIDENRFSLAANAEYEVKQGQIIKDKYTPLVKELKNMQTDKIFDKFGIEVEHDKDNKIILSHFSATDEMIKDGVSFNDLEVNLDKLLKNVKEIKGNARFVNVAINNLNNLETIGGDANLSFSKIGNIPNLKTIGGNANFSYTEVKNIGGLKTIKGNASIHHATIDDISGLTEIEGNAEFYGIVPKKYNLRKIGGSATFDTTEIEDLSKLETIGGDANFNMLTHIKDISGLKSIGGNAKFSYATIGDMSALERIEGNLEYGFSSIQKLDSLKYVGGEIIEDSINWDFGRKEVNDVREKIDSIEEFKQKMVKRNSFMERFREAKQRETNQLKEEQIMDIPEEEELTKKPEKKGLVSWIKNLFSK